MDIANLFSDLGDGSVGAYTDTCVSSFVVGEKVMRDDEFTCDLFRFLQLLCEGHNSGECVFLTLYILNHTSGMTKNKQEVPSIIMNYSFILGDAGEKCFQLIAFCSYVSKVYNLNDNKE